jgi:hypothetical protein
MAPAAAGPLPDLPRLRELLQRAERGDQGALTELREVATPAGLAGVMGDLPREVVTAMVGRLYGKDRLASRAGLEERARLVSDELAGPNPPPVLRLLAEAAGVAWLHYHALELIQARQDGLPLDMGVYLERMLTQAQKRYLRALREVTTLRQKLGGK